MDRIFKEANGNRSCSHCEHCIFWEEDEQFFWDCEHKEATNSIWFEKLLFWEIDPGRFCGHFKFDLYNEYDGYE